MPFYGVSSKTAVMYTLQWILTAFLMFLVLWQEYMTSHIFKIEPGAMLITLYRLVRNKPLARLGCYECTSHTAVGCQSVMQRTSIQQMSRSSGQNTASHIGPETSRSGATWPSQIPGQTSVHAKIASNYPQITLFNLRSQRVSSTLRINNCGQPYASRDISSI